jgi:hypothetical protein
MKVCIIFKAVLMLIVDFLHNVDWSGRCETPAGEACHGRPRRRIALRRLPDRPRKASAWSGNQHSNLTQIFKKGWVIVNFAYLPRICPFFMVK